jgi:hypothetical protein
MEGDDETMETKFTVKQSAALAVSALAVGILCGSSVGVPAQTVPAAANHQEQEIAPGKFYCNLKALNPAEREHHLQLSEKLMAVHRQIVEIAKGYEFQFSPASVTLAELADWVKAESKCCPFFDFHIDLEQKGKLLCLRLTGEQGIKQFIRSEFQLPAK